MRKLRISGQHLTEVALCLAVVSAAILVMRFYVLRSLQARYKDGADYVIKNIKHEATLRNDTSLMNIKKQYDPYYSEAYTQEDKTANITTGYPDSSVNQTVTRYGVQIVNAPGSAD